MNKYAKLLRSDFLILKRDYLKIVKDLNTAVYLSYLIDKYDYFSSNNMITIFDNEEYFFNIQKDIEETIYLSPKQQRSCLDVLIKLKIVKTKLKGIPAKTFFNIDFDLLVELLMNIGNTSNKEKLQQDVTKGNNNNLQNVTYITNNKELITNNNIKNKNSKINELIFQQQNEIDNVFNGIFDLSVKYDFNDIDNQSQLNEMLKSENMNKLKRTYLDIKRENSIERKTYQNTLAYHKNNLKVNCLTSIWLYDYEILKLRMKYNADYLLKTIYKIDIWLQDPTNFAKKLDHYTTIENWIKKDIGHILSINTHIRVDRKNYLNHGVDYDLFK